MASGFGPACFLVLEKKSSREVEVHPVACLKAFSFEGHRVQSCFSTTAV